MTTKKTTLPLRAVIKKFPDVYIGWIEGLPGANSQAKTLPELHANLIEAAKDVLDFHASKEKLPKGFKRVIIELRM